MYLLALIFLCLNVSTLISLRALSSSASTDNILKSVYTNNHYNFYSMPKTTQEVQLRIIASKYNSSMLQYVIDQLEAKRKNRPTSTPTLTSTIITTITAITKPTRLTKKPKIKTTKNSSSNEKDFSFSSVAPTKKVKFKTKPIIPQLTTTTRLDIETTTTTNSFELFTSTINTISSSTPPPTPSSPLNPSTLMIENPTTTELVSLETTAYASTTIEITNVASTSLMISTTLESISTYEFKQIDQQEETNHLVTTTSISDNEINEIFSTQQHHYQQQLTTQRDYLQQTINYSNSLHYNNNNNKYLLVIFLVIFHSKIN